MLRHKFLRCYYNYIEAVFSDLREQASFLERKTFVSSNKYVKIIILSTS